MTESKKLFVFTRNHPSQNVVHSSRVITEHRISSPAKHKETLQHVVYSIFTTFSDVWVEHIHLFSVLIKTLLPLNDKIELMSSNGLISNILKADARCERARSIMLMNVYTALHLGREGEKKMVWAKHHHSGHISVSWDKFTIV